MTQCYLCEKEFNDKIGDIEFHFCRSCRNLRHRCDEYRKEERHVQIFEDGHLIYEDEAGYNTENIKFCPYCGCRLIY